MKRIVNLVAAIMLVVGFVILIQPYWRDYRLKKENEQVINEFIEYSKNTSGSDSESIISESHSQSDITESSSEDLSLVSDTEFFSMPLSDEDVRETMTSENAFPELFAQMQEYNRRIFEENQSELRDAFSYTTNDFNFASYGVNDNVAGYITIERMNVRMALYIGSSLQNMSRGATVMNQTSMPIGGVNTNCVIAAHRSRGFFGEIEKLRIGDTIKINNLWEELTYRVIKIIVIDPYDVDKVKIFPEQDMITLLTCHPYTSNTHRYVVYCVRDEDNALSQEDGESGTQSSQSVDDSSETSDSDGKHAYAAHVTKTITYEELPDGIEFESSEEIIKNENILRLSGIALTGFFLLIFLIMFLRSLFSKAASRKSESDVR